MSKSRKIIIVGMANFKFRPSIKSSKASRLSFQSNFFGFGLIEVVVAMAIIAIVAVGTTKLAIAARRAEYDAQLRRIAMMLLTDMQDRMKSNRSESTYNNGANYVASIPLAGSSLPATTCIGANFIACTPAQMAAYDLWDWSQYIKSLLPAPASAPLATIVNNTTNTNYVPPSFTITINWTGSAGSNQSQSILISTPL